MCIYEKLLEVAEDGGSYKIDLKRKNLRIGHKQYIKDGEVLVDEDLINEDGSWERVSELYQQFKHSRPRQGEKDGKFKALTMDELTTAELAFNMPRHLARAMLEGYILLCGMKGVLQWENDEYWFWQDQNDLDCIVLKTWI